MVEKDTMASPGKVTRELLVFWKESSASEKYASFEK